MKFIKNLLKAFCMSFSMFCAIPTPFVHVWEDSVHSLMLVVFPFVGAIIGTIWCGISVLLEYFKVPILFSGAILAITPYLLTGGIHLDGYMDCCDAIFSRRPLEKRREILKDSHVGSFAVIGLVILMIVTFSALASVQMEHKAWLFISICMISRACSAIGVFSLRPMEHSEYAGNFKKGIGKSNIIALILIIILVFCVSYFAYSTLGLIVCAITALGYILATVYAFKDLNGFSGDVTGFGHTIAELCGIVALVLM